MKRENGQDEADDRYDASCVRGDLQNDLVRTVQRYCVHVHQHGEIRQVIALALGMGLVSLYYLTSFVCPGATENKILREGETYS